MSFRGYQADSIAREEFPFVQNVCADHRIQSVPDYLHGPIGLTIYEVLIKAGGADHVFDQYTSLRRLTTDTSQDVQVEA